MGILIKNGTVIDGSGKAGIKADVYIKDDKIARMGEGIEAGALAEDPGATVIDAAGKVVCPGFIDIHSHSDFSMPVGGGPMTEKLRQGVTTAVLGSCGMSAAPVNGRALKFLKKFTSGMFGTQCPYEWETMGQYIEYIRKRGHGANVVPQVGYANVRLMATGFKVTAPSAAQMKQIKKILAQAIDEGARGFTTGLVYPPQLFAKEPEVREVVMSLKGRDIVYATHVRNEMDRVEDAYREAIETARDAGLSLQISHHKAVLKRNWGKVRKTVAAIEAARASGLDVESDVYPYTSFSNIFIPLVLLWEKGMEKDIVFIEMTKRKELEGRTFESVMKESGRGVLLSALGLALQEGFTKMPIAGFMMSEDDVRYLVAHPLLSIGSDGVELPGRKAHPRLYGTCVRVIETYALKQKALPLEEAIRKMTSMPANKMKLKMRGTLREGYFADVVVFDPERIHETTTYDDPVQFPVGFDAVIVNGEIAVRDDEQTAARAGQVL